MANVKASEMKDGDVISFKPAPGDMAVLQDFQLGVNHLNAAMGRFLGHIGVAKHDLVEGAAYEFNPNWKEGTIDVKLVPTPKEQVKLED